MIKADPDQKQPGIDDPGQPPESPESFERLIAEISGRFTPLGPKNVDCEIDAVLALVGDFMGVDRCFIFSLSEDESRHVVSHLWTRPEYVQDAVVLGTVVQDGFPWVGEQMLRRKDIVINELGDFPPEAGAERGYCESIGIRSFLMGQYQSDRRLGLYQFLRADLPAQRQAMIGVVYRPEFDANLEGDVNFSNFASPTPTADDDQGRLDQPAGAAGGPAIPGERPNTPCSWMPTGRTGRSSATTSCPSRAACESGASHLTATGRTPITWVWAWLASRGSGIFSMGVSVRQLAGG